MEGDKEAIGVWEKILEGNFKALTSSLVLFELRGIFLKLGRSVVPVDIDVAEEGASLSYGTGLTATDALIYSCVSDADRFYTTDGSFEVLKKKKPRIVRM